MTEHENVKESLKRLMSETHARIDQDVEKLKSRPEYEMLPNMVKCYIDIVILDINLLKEREKLAHSHIDILDHMLDEYRSTV